MTSLVSVDPVYCEMLVTRVICGHVTSWQLLVEHVWPHLLRQISANRSVRPWVTEDDARNIGTAVLEKLCVDEYQALRRYFDWKQGHEGSSFRDWLFILSTNTARDYRRARFTQRRKPAWEGPSVKRFLNEFTASTVLEEVGARPPVTTNQTARQVLELAQRSLDENQYTALQLWLQGLDPDDIADVLGTADEDGAIRLVRSAIAVLRR